MVAEAERQPRRVAAALRRSRRRWRVRFARPSRLTLRILAINLLALVILAGGLLYLDRYQRGLIAAELDALGRQAEILARAVGELAVEPQPDGQASLPAEVVRQMIRRIGGSLPTRARVFGQGGRILADSHVLSSSGGFVRVERLPPPGGESALGRFAVEIYDALVDWLPRRGEVPPYREEPEQRAEHYGEVGAALEGETATAVRIAESGVLVLSVAVPVQRYKQVLGALMLSSEAREIDEALRTVRFEVLRVFAVAFATTVLLSMWLASTITRPIERLAAAAERIRLSRTRQLVIPDFTERRDEIGELSRSLRAMTDALWHRLDAIERFAADVAHEIKNPLSSVRSAVETAARVSDPEQQRRLLAIILDDVQRLDRLISDISDASRIDAELSREEAEPVDLARLLATLAELYQQTRAPDGPQVSCALADRERLVAAGTEDRLAQVLRNLIANAISFSPPGGQIALSGRLDGEEVVIAVEDEGIGIPDGKLEAIFERFYSERPEGEKFGTHSGLGLSISKQIIEAHGGTIHAENRHAPDGRVIGARFVVRLPRARRAEAS